MNYVQSHTSIPIPLILDVHYDADEPEESWILMSRLPGRQLGEVWPNMSESARAQTILQLKSYLEQLHRLQPSSNGWIGSCANGPAYDHRINNRSTCGPFTSVREFHDFLVAPVKKGVRPDWVGKYRSRLPDSHHIIFTHADFSWENVLVDPITGEVTGFLDWEMAGFWPEWWEYRKALYGGRSQPWWFNILGQIMQEYPDETDADMDLEWF